MPTKFRVPVPSASAAVDSVNVLLYNSSPLKAAMTSSSNLVVQVQDHQQQQDEGQKNLHSSEFLSEASSETHQQTEDHQIDDNDTATRAKLGRNRAPPKRFIACPSLQGRGIDGGDAAFLAGGLKREAKKKRGRPPKDDGAAVEAKKRRQSKDVPKTAKARPQYEYCKFDGCSKLKQGAGGYCHTHKKIMLPNDSDDVPNYKRCKFEDCTKFIQGVGGYCFSHKKIMYPDGNGNDNKPSHLCKFEDCTKLIQGAGGFCNTHKKIMYPEGVGEKEQGNLGRPRNEATAKHSRLCKFDGCTKFKQGAGGYCHSHKKIMNNNGKKKAPPKKATRKAAPKANRCKADGCTKFRQGAGGYCHSHKKTMLLHDENSGEKSQEKRKRGRPGRPRKTESKNTTLRNRPKDEVGSTQKSSKGNSDGTCNQEGCMYLAQSGGFCFLHGLIRPQNDQAPQATEKAKHSNDEAAPKKAKLSKWCQFKGCTKYRQTSQYCRAHEKRMLADNHGSDSDGSAFAVAKARHYDKHYDDGAAWTKTEVKVKHSKDGAVPAKVDAEAKHSKWCKLEGCTKYRQARCGGYCMAHMKIMLPDKNKNCSEVQDEHKQGELSSRVSKPEVQSDQDSDNSGSDDDTIQSDQGSYHNGSDDGTCNHQGCMYMAQTGGFCFIHGLKLHQSVPPAQIAPSQVKNRTQQAQGTRRTQSRSYKACSHRGCNNYARKKGLCCKHGGFNVCSHKGCTRVAQRKGKLCWVHCDGENDPVPDPTPKPAISRKRNICTFSGCNLFALIQGPNAHLEVCHRHVPCSHDGCKSMARKKGYLCKRHYRQSVESRRILMTAGGRDEMEVAFCHFLKIPFKSSGLRLEPKSKDTRQHEPWPVTQMKKDEGASPPRATDASGSSDHQA